MSVGRTTDISSLGEIPENVLVRGFVPQLEVLERVFISSLFLFILFIYYLIFIIPENVLVCGFVPQLQVLERVFILFYFILFYFILFYLFIIYLFIYYFLFDYLVIWLFDLLFLLMFLSVVCSSTSSFGKGFLFLFFY